MGAEVSAQSYSREERQRYREKVRQNLDVFERMLNQSRFEFDKPMTGLEIELNLVDGDHQPHFHNAEVLAAIADEDYQTELAQYNIELNVPPRPLPGDAALDLEAELRASLNRADAKAREVGSKIVAIGILPTMYDGRSNHAREVLADLGDRYGLPVLSPPIPRTVRFAEAPAIGRSILDTARSSKGAQAYREVAESLLAQL